MFFLPVTESVIFTYFLKNNLMLKLIVVMIHVSIPLSLFCFSLLA